MSSMDDQGHLPPHVEPGRRRGPEAKDAPPESGPEGARLHDEDAGTARPRPHAAPPFEPADGAVRTSDTGYGKRAGGAP
jgi:hypothetical protein